MVPCRVTSSMLLESLTWKSKLSILNSYPPSKVGVEPGEPGRGPVLMMMGDDGESMLMSWVGRADESMMVDDVRSMQDGDGTVKLIDPDPFFPTVGAN
jgi:hypothetical protein